MLTLAKHTSQPMELLTALSRTPAAVSDLMQDFGWTRNEIKRALSGIRQMDITVHAGRNGTIWIDDASWPRAQIMATGYFERTYQQ